MDYNGCDSNNAGCLWYSKTKNSNDRIYFNNKIQACNVKDDGCHEFIQLSNIKDGLTNAAVINVIQSDTEQNDNYSNYATVNKIYLNKKAIECNEANAGCEKYTPTNGDSSIPGIVKIDNICPKECVGYKAYHQLRTNFEDDFYTSLIPNGKQCSASEAGCDEFTNLNEIAKGGESKEYYTYLRRCVKTSEPGCGVFYTWIGSDTQGFQLKAYNLQKVTNDNKENDDEIVGEPKTTTVSLNLGSCANETDALNNPECKEFFDELGNKYYKIYKNTITCSEDCQPLRKSNATASDCGKQGGDWDDTNSRCIFMAIPKEGTTCSASSNGCRAYRGNHGDNIRIILQDNFEDDESTGWENAEIKNDADVIAGHSIKSDNNLIQSSDDVMSPLLIQNKSYEISFWAKSGNTTGGENTEVRFNNGTTPLSFGTQPIGTEWNKYTFGPLLFNRQISEAEQLEIVGNVYVDNIMLKEITNDIYLIKNSWNVPTSCDQTLNQEDSPQAMLNCAEYQDRRGAFQYLKSFTSICADNYVGCQTLIDTKNSTSPYEEIKKGITIPKDEIKYYVNNPLNYCSAQEKGCESFGLPDLDINGTVKIKDEKEIWKDVYLRNNPDQYEALICSSEGMACQEYKYNVDAIIHFKDPKDKVCEYKLVNGQENHGWYKKGTEVGAPNCECEYKLIYGQTEKYGWFIKGSKSNLPDCGRDGEVLGGWTGICSANYSSCTQFIDPLDPLDPLDDQSFYYLNNDKIDRNSPNGLVSKKEGKILFNDTAKTGLIYNTDETYKNSEKEGKAVSPVSDCNSPSLACYKEDKSFKNPLPSGCAEKMKDNITLRKECNANSIIKVDRDRVCGQWLSCENSAEVFSEGKNKNICNENGLCKKFADGASSGCEEWVTGRDGNLCLDDLECLSGKCGLATTTATHKTCLATFVLDEDNYKKRNV
ncbi:MAG: hypothetical protein C0412_12900, partial [Flavobacterium sp.]|nr:hypothetical protein [Flavobacterium sp.]